MKQDHERPPLTNSQWRAVFASIDSGELNVATDDPLVRSVYGEFVARREATQTNSASHESFAHLADGLLASAAVGAGQRLGNYTLLEPLGRGGMGSVWRARRNDGLYDAEVAIKLLGTLALSAQARARFAREGQLLSRLAHPNIARLLDAGVTEDGQRFLVIEKIEGTDIAAHCAGKPVAETLAVFRQLLSAVAYAHSQLVLHRDLKPANVLVDRSGQVKLLDFGVAKLAVEEGEDDGLTRAMGQALTERYAAPEQFGSDNVGTSADVFALGSLLIELLAAEKIEWSHPKREWLNPALSVSLRTSLALLHDDLQAIANKATAREPAERYASVGEFEDDVARFLASEPVRARPAGAWYRFGKFVQRHRGSFGAGVAAALAVVASLVFAIIQLLEAREQERVAQTEATKAKEIAKFTTGLFTVLDPKIASSVDRSKLTAKQILDAGRERIKTELHDQPEVRLALLGTLAEMYGRIADEKSFVELLEERVALARATHGEHHPIVYETQLMDVWSDIYGGLIADAKGKLAALDMNAAARGEKGDAGDERAADRLFAWAKIATAEGVENSEAQLQRYRVALVEFNRVKSNSANYAATRANYASALASASQPALALDELSRAIEIFEVARKRDPSSTDIGDLAGMFGRRGTVAASLNRLSEAEVDLRQAIKLSSESGGPHHVITKVNRAELAYVLHRQDRREDAWKQMAEVDATPATIVAGTLGLEYIELIRARMLAREERFREAIESTQKAIDGWRTAKNNPVRLREAETFLGELQIAQSRAGDRPTKQ